MVFSAVLMSPTKTHEPTTSLAQANQPVDNPLFVDNSTTWLWITAKKGRFALGGGKTRTAKLGHRGGGPRQAALYIGAMRVQL